MRVTQRGVFDWCVKTFGEKARLPKQRGSRTLEEAAELAQALGVEKTDADAIVARVFSRPAGDPAQELGGLMVTTWALAEAIGLDANTQGLKEFGRVLKTDPEVFRRKQADKVNP